MYSKLTFDEIEGCFPDDYCTDDKTGKVQVSAQWLHDFAHAIEDKLADKNEALLKRALIALDDVRMADRSPLQESVIRAMEEVTNHSPSYSLGIK